jgi:hypothetical protein
MRRSKQLFLDDIAYVFWRSGQPIPAALLIGASDADLARNGTTRRSN